MSDKKEQEKEIIADLHIHSRFSRATSNKLNIQELEKFAKIKGVNLLGTGDFQHPEWIKELERDLVEERDGIAYTKNSFPFLWQTEISLMYSQGGKGRRIHHVILAPNKEVVGQVTDWLKSKGRIDYDGRPIFGFSSIELVEQLKRIDDKVEIIPAHCLLPDSLVHVKNKIKKISDIRKGDFVLTHKGIFRRVTKCFSRKYSGQIIKLVPSCLKVGSWFTPEHPVLSIKSYKKCKNVPHTICKPSCAYLKRGCKIKAYEKYKKEWNKVEDLTVGDIILYPRYKVVRDILELNLSEVLKNFYVNGEYIQPRKGKPFIKNIPIKNKIEVTEDFCRLLGYYLAEGYVSKGHIGFTFNKKEIEYIEDVKKLLKECFGPFLNIQLKNEKSKGLTVLVYSNILTEFFKGFYDSRIHRAHTKKIPSWVLDLPKEKLKQLFLGWWRGDLGVTASPNLMNQFKTILLKLGVVPSIDFVSADKLFKYRKKHPSIIENRKIKAGKGCYSFRFLCFFDENLDFLQLPEFKKFKTKLYRCKAWIDEDYVYLPLIKINKKIYSGKVYNLEVNQHNTYVTENLIVHNCMTPWFGIFGSKGGFDSLKECFQDKADKIYAVESGISADPKMLRKFSFLNNKSVVSFSDLHSFWPWRIGREDTIFKGKLTYDNIIKQIRENSFKATIETEPAYGRYHYDGHRNCDFSCSPEKTRELGGICPKCHQKLTIGVENRVEELTDQEAEHQGKKPFYKLLPLHELIALAKGTSISTKTVWQIYNQLIDKFGNEFNILLNVEKEKLLREISNEQLVQLIIDNRKANLKIKPGYDGNYGKILLKEKQGKLF